MGSVYLILGTNIGARLGFLVALCGLAGWMALMGGIWWIYIGLKALTLRGYKCPAARDQDAGDLYQAGVLENRLPLDGLAVPADINEVVFDGFVNEGGSACRLRTCIRTGSSLGNRLLEEETRSKPARSR